MAAVSDNVSGFDWDRGNRAKCQKHGISIADIEGLFDRPVAILPDDLHSSNEERLKAIGTTTAGRFLFLVFTLRMRDGHVWIRPISARFMHPKEVAYYEEEAAKAR